MLAAQQVVDAIEARLDTVAATGGRVYRTRRPIDEANLPAWRLLAGSEEVASQTMHYPAVELHTLDVSAAGIAQDTTALEEELDALAEAALVALFATAANASLSPLNVEDMQCTAIDREGGAEGEARVGRITLTLQVKFLTMQNDPATIN